MGLSCWENLIESNMGINLSIDDLGTGYSSFAYLKKLPVNEIKVDKSFVIDMLDSKRDEIIVNTVINLAHNLGLQVVAEGIESKEVWDNLQAYESQWSICNMRCYHIK